MSSPVQAASDALIIRATQGIKQSRSPQVIPGDTAYVPVRQRLENCRASLEGARVSGQRFLQASARLAAILAANPSLTRDPSPEVSTLSNEAQVDKSAMLSFLGRSHVQLGNLARTQGLSADVAATAAEFHKQVPDAHDLRNMVAMTTRKGGRPISDWVSYTAAH